MSTKRVLRRDNYKAWSILGQNAEIWQCGYASKDEAFSVLDTQQLQDMRNLFYRGAGRKDVAIAKIHTRWPTLRNKLSLSDQGDHYPEHLARVTERHPLNECARVSIITPLLLRTRLWSHWVMSIL